MSEKREWHQHLATVVCIWMSEKERMGINQTSAGCVPAFLDISMNETELFQLAEKAVALGSIFDAKVY